MEKLRNKTVLIVDDDNANIFALSSYLETLEMMIRVAKDGQEAIALLRDKEKPDIILLDMMMPVMDGYETLAALGEQGILKIIPVIAVTAKAMKGDKEKCLDAGASDYVAKPLNLKELVEKMDHWMK